MKRVTNESEDTNSIRERMLDRQLHRALAQLKRRRRDESDADTTEPDVDAAEPGSDKAKTTWFSCETKPKIRTGAIGNAVRAQKTNPIEPISAFGMVRSVV